MNLFSFIKFVNILTTWNISISLKKLIKLHTIVFYINNTENTFIMT
jgi:hypothetical protein